MIIPDIHTQNKTFEDFAGELIDEICESTSINTPVDLENGLTGIGRGIEYLVKNRFYYAEIDEVVQRLIMSYTKQ